MTHDSANEKEDGMYCQQKYYCLEIIALGEGTGVGVTVAWSSMHLIYTPAVSAQPSSWSRWQVVIDQSSQEVGKQKERKIRIT